MTEPQFKPIADHALLVTFAEEISDAANASVVALDQAIARAGIAGVVEVVPAFVNLLISFDPVETDHGAVEAAVRPLIDGLGKVEKSSTLRTVQVCYEGDLAPDLEAVAEACGMTRDAVINAHLGGDYHVVMYGFAPGYAYMGGVPSAIQVPRKPAALRGIPAGSVLIAGAQCLVSTLRMPTGWSIIGRSPTRILLDEPDRPFLFDVGDAVAFERIDLASYEQLTKETGNG